MPGAGSALGPRLHDYLVVRALQVCLPEGLDAQDMTQMGAPELLFVPPFSHPRACRVTRTLGVDNTEKQG